LLFFKRYGYFSFKKRKKSNNFHFKKEKYPICSLFGEVENGAVMQEASMYISARTVQAGNP